MSMDIVVRAHVRGIRRSRGWKIPVRSGFTLLCSYREFCNLIYCRCCWFAGARFAEGVKVNYSAGFSVTFVELVIIFSRLEILSKIKVLPGAD